MRFLSSLILVGMLFFITACGFIKGSSSDAYKIEQVKIHLDNAKWDKALDILNNMEDSNEVHRLRAGAYGGKAGLSVIQMGLKFIGKGSEEKEENEETDFLSFLNSIGVTSHVSCGSSPCIANAINEITKITPQPSKSDYFLSAFFRLFQASVNFLSITNITEFEYDSVLSDGVSGKTKISCYVNTFQIEITGIQSDLANAGVDSGDEFFTAIDDMFKNLTHCAGYVPGNVNDIDCAASKKDSEACKWACSSVFVAEGGGYDDTTKKFNGIHPDGSGTLTSCESVTDGEDVPGSLNWDPVIQPSSFAIVSSSEAIGGLLQNIGAN